MRRAKCPSPDEIKTARAAAGLTQMQAAELVHVDLRTWQKWEGEEREINLAAWELFRLKIAGTVHPALDAVGWLMPSGLFRVDKPEGYNAHDKAVCEMAERVYKLR